ncbi:MAG: nucleoside phosphorylase [Flavobacteriaceae bacterium]|nr:nucleoside phosphorylase [Flavobacteriaceae bacterium]
MPLGASELIINADGSIYHLHLLPEDIAETIFLVGDPNRVARVSAHFDRIEIKKERREFITHTGYIGERRISVLSTGIGTDNIDIVINELDALVNIDFSTREVKEEHTPLNLVRLGTSGSIQAHINVDDILGSSHAIGFDNVIHYYESEHVQETEIQEAFIKATNWPSRQSRPYVVKGSEKMKALFADPMLIDGFIGTNVGFYGPQGRKLRVDLREQNLIKKLAEFEYQGLRITNLEMETSAIYGLAALLGHHGYSINCILANRANGQFSPDPAASVDKLIEFALQKIRSAWNG